MQLPNFFHIGAVRGIHLTHTCANPGTIEMPAAIHTWARWALGQKFRPDLIGFIVAQGQPTIECRDSLYVAPVLDRRLPIARASRTRSSSRLVPLIHQAFGVRLASGRHSSRQLEGEAALAASTRTDQREETRRSEQRESLAKLALPSHEPSRRARQTGRRTRERRVVANDRLPELLEIGVRSRAEFEADRRCVDA